MRFMVAVLLGSVGLMAMVSLGAVAMVE